MKIELLRKLVAEASLAPSVHNVQPARWRIGDDEVTLFEDKRRRLPAADPKGDDAAMSLGAASEGLRIAASRVGLHMIAGPVTRLDDIPHLERVATFRFEKGGSPDPLADFVDRRQSWRGKFAGATDEDRNAATALSAEDATVLATPVEVEKVSLALDRASWRFMSQTSFREELVSWMRLSRSNPRWTRDGLNAEAMAMSGFEAFGARVVLGAAFPLLKAMGLAKPLLAEAAKTRSAAAIVLFHRSTDEDPRTSGGQFYRFWLRIEKAGFGAAVLAALADDPKTSAELATSARLPAGRRLVSAFRVGRRPARGAYERARLPLDELIVP